MFYSTFYGKTNKLFSSNAIKEKSITKHGILFLNIFPLCVLTTMLPRFGSEGVRRERKTKASRETYSFVSSPQMCNKNELQGYQLFLTEAEIMFIATHPACTVQACQHV